MRYSFQLSISSRRWHFREAYADHITRADLGSTISQQASHYFRMAQVCQARSTRREILFLLILYLVGV